MWNNLLAFWLEGKEILPDNQHGFRPGKGTSTAWSTMLETVIKSPNIYEVDFTSYFDTIKLNAIKWYLEQSGIPENIVSRLVWMHSVAAKLPAKELLDETGTKIKQNFIDNRSGILDNLSW
jgi:hypothetical protein